MHLVDFFDEKEEGIAEEEASVTKHESSFVTTKRIWQGIHKDLWIVAANVKNTSSRYHSSEAIQFK